jgi:hypothetical protein
MTVIGGGVANAWNLFEKDMLRQVHNTRFRCLHQK